MSVEGEPEPTAYQRFLESLRSRHTLRSHIWQSLANYSQQGFGLMFGIALARLLTPVDFGTYGLALAITLLALLPAMWSFAPTLLADCGRTPGLFDVVASFTWAVVGVRLAIVFGVVVWLFSTGTPILAELCIVIGVSESFRELNNVQKGLLEGFGRFSPNFVSAVANMTFCLIVVLPICFFYKSPFILTLPALGTVMSDFLIYRYFTRRTVIVRPRLVVPRQFFQNGFWLWLNSASDVGLARADKFFIGNFMGDTVLGHYSRAFGYAPLAFLALNSLATNPTVSGLARQQERRARLYLFTKTAAILLGGGILNWLLFFPFADKIILTVFGPQWEPTIPIFRAFASLSLAYAITYLPIAALYAQKRYQAVGIVRVIMLGVLVGIILLQRQTLSATFVAWLLQAILCIQGIILLFLAYPTFQRDTGASINA